MEVSSQLGEFSPGELLLALELFSFLLNCIFVKLFLKFLVLFLESEQILLEFVEVVAVLACVIPPVTELLPSVHLLDDGGLMREKLHASAVEFLFAADGKLLAGVVRPEGSLNADGG